MSDMITHVAKAILAADEGEYFATCLKPRDILYLARAAIEAMREPTVAMVDAGVAMALNVSVHGQGGWSRYIEGLHRQIISAALSQDTHSLPSEDR